MFVANNLIFDSTATAANGVWRDVSNWVAYSVHITGLEGTTWIEVSNDPAVKTDGTAISAPSAPTLSQAAVYPGNTSGTWYAKVTYVTPGGETVGSSESSLTVTSGNELIVASPAQDAGGYAVGWNVYVGNASGKNFLQNQTTLQFGQTFVLGLPLTSGTPVPTSNTSGSPAAGINITGNLAANPYVYPSGAEEMQIITDSTSKQAIINPSCLVWNWIRVCKTGGSGLETKAFLFGQQG